MTDQARNKTVFVGKSTCLICGNTFDTDADFTTHYESSHPYEARIKPTYTMTFVTAEAEDTDESRKSLLRMRLFNLIYESTADILVADRKRQGDLPVGTIEYAIHTGVMSLDEFVDSFRETLRERIEDNIDFYRDVPESEGYTLFHQNTDEGQTNLTP